ncbi:MAG: small subunit of monooxygenase [Rubrivivax sp. SCN 70-15]|nr:MAG: small subunit of monooxygenase [Rubrivivax sp. SCN 70-15]
MTPKHLNVQPNFGIPGERYRHPYMPGDAFYERLVDAHRDLDDAASERLNARLVLLLANHIGDLRVLAEAIDLARAGVAAEGDAP